MRILTISLFTVLVLVAASCNPAPPVAVSERPLSNNRMPRLNLPVPPSKPLEKLGWTLFDGGRKEIMDDRKGKVLLLDFWATYCGPCIEAIPHLKELKEKHGEQLVIIGLHVGGEEDRERVPEFRKRLEIDYPIATPEDELTYLLLGDDNRIPQTLVFDREGKLVEKFVSYDETIGKQIEATVEKTVNQ